MAFIRSIFIYLFLCYFATLNGQNFSGVVLDKNTGRPLSNCIVIVKGAVISTLSDSKGAFSIPELPGDKKTTLVFSMLGYTTAEYVLNKYAKDTFYLDPKNFILNEVVISANKKNTLNPKSEESILDFEILNDNLLLLTAQTTFNTLKLLNEYGDPICRMKVNKNSEKLDQDCLGNLHLFSADSSWQLFYDFEKLNSLNPYSLKNYNEILGNCMCSKDENYYFRNYSYRNLRCDYCYYNEKQKGMRHELVKFQESTKIHQFELDYDLQYFLKVKRSSNYTMYNEPVDVLIKNMDRYREELPLDWAYTKWLGSIQTEMIKVDTALYIINFTDSCIYFLNSNNELKLQSNFQAMKARDLLLKIYVDTESKETYLIQFTNNTLVLLKFDIRTGKEISKTEIPKIAYLPRKIIIHNRRAYFVEKNLVADQAYKMIKYYLN